MSRRMRVKPGKGQSIVGLIGGLAFVCIGIFHVIPTFGAFGFIWTMFAIGMTAVNGINAFSKKGVVSHEVIFDDDDNKEVSYQREERKEETVEERLKNLQRLYDNRTITSDEYQEKRREILKDL